MIYVEVIFLNNLAIDVFLVLNTLVLQKRKISKIRVILSSLTGAVFAVGYLFVPHFAQIIIKILLALLMSAMFDKYKNAKEYLKSTAVFVMLTYFFGGIVSGISNFVCIDLTKYLLLAFVIISLFLAEIVILILVRTASKRHKMYKTATLVFGEKSCKLRALYDSGNALCDTYSGLPVVVLSKSGKIKLNALDIRNIDNFEGFINAKTLSGSAEMPMIKIDKIVLDNQEYRCMIAISENDFDDCEIILHNSMTGDDIYESKRNFSKNFKFLKN